ncbi:ribosome maturation factor RimM [Nibrella viscosa]|uniref:Ribosome maturation factor RimM n=1 Tax=Nibrella viscosa TaxID=1084524 RepID=A0ABP8K099_9BACT
MSLFIRTGSLFLQTNIHVTKDDCFQLGHITRTHGTQGELVFYLDVDEPSAYEELESVLIEVKGELLPYFIESIAIINKSRAIVALEEVETIDQAEKLINCALYLPLDNLEPIEDETRFYYHEIIGYRVVDAEQGELGTVTAVYTMPTQDLISMEYQGKEVLIPINSAIVPSVDRTRQQLNVVLPDGLLDVYMTETDKEKPEINGDVEHED